MRLIIALFMIILFGASCCGRGSVDSPEPRGIVIPEAETGISLEGSGSVSEDIAQAMGRREEIPAGRGR